MSFLTQDRSMSCKDRDTTLPIVGKTVVTRGLVTAVDSQDFYLQDAVGNGHIATSDALFVFTGKPPTVEVGDEIRVAGRIEEYIPDKADPRSLSVTRLVSPRITRLSEDNLLPPPMILGSDGRRPPTENSDDDAFSGFEPATDGVDFFESLEGMRVTARNAVAMTGTNRAEEVFAVVDGAASGLSVRGTLNIGPNDFNLKRIRIDADAHTLAGFERPLVHTGAVLGDITGVISYDSGSFKLDPIRPFVPKASNLVPERSELMPGPQQLTVASYNVLNLDPNDRDGDTDIANGRFAAIAEHIRNHLRELDIIGLQEIHDNSGLADDGAVAANITLQLLIDAIAASGGPGYAFIDHPFVGKNTDGHRPGVNVRTAFLYQPSRVTLSAVRSIMPASLWRDSINPFVTDRSPLVVDFTFRGTTLTLVNNHFPSKYGSPPILGTEQPFETQQEDPAINNRLDIRRVQAQVIEDFVDPILTASPDARVIVLGALNEFELVSPIADILSNGLTNPVNDLPEDERYSFIFLGNSHGLHTVQRCPETGCIRHRPYQCGVRGYTASRQRSRPGTRTLFHPGTP